MHPRTTATRTQAGKPQLRFACQRPDSPPPCRQPQAPSCQQRAQDANTPARTAPHAAAGWLYKAHPSSSSKQASHSHAAVAQRTTPTQGLSMLAAQQAAAVTAPLLFNAACSQPRPGLTPQSSAAPLAGPALLPVQSESCCCALSCLCFFFFLSVVGAASPSALCFCRHGSNHQHSQQPSGSTSAQQNKESTLRGAGRAARA